MTRDRFDLALERISSSDWQLFEKLASEFLTVEFSELRTVASVTGDRGRDAFLFTPEGDSSILLQYSISEDWPGKINATMRRVKKEFPDLSILVYVTNRVVGAKADDLRTRLRTKYGVHLDVRDRSWFLDRLHSNVQRERAASDLAKRIVDPYLAGKGVIAGKSSALSEDEVKAAFVYLNLQWQDDNRSKGLTRVCFEALVRAALRDTDSENRLKRDEVRAQVRSILSTHPDDLVDRFTDSALHRLTKRSVRHWVASDEFCLSHEERQRLKERLASLEKSDVSFRKRIEELVLSLGSKIPNIASVDLLNDVAERINRIMSSLLLSRGESFANSVIDGQLSRLDLGDLPALVVKDLARYPDVESDLKGRLPDLIVRVIPELLSNPGDKSHRYLRSLADTYTLLAFLRETPDVQSAITKMFSHGDFWLDTSVVLPVFADDLLPPAGRQFTKLLVAARNSGLKLRITPGVLEEIDRHINRCMAYARSFSDWTGKVPFLFEKYSLSGRPVNGFSSWLENFRGQVRPEDDIADYLQRFFGIEVISLEEQADAAPSDLRHAVQEIWHEAHEARRNSFWAELDALSAQRLVKHDVENYLGVVVRRNAERGSPFGFSSWWLTLDRIAFDVANRLKGRIDGRVPSSPVLSPDFLVNYLAFGPIRSRIPKSTESAFPLALDVRAGEYAPEELITLAEQYREEMKSLPEHVITRKIRDRLDEAKARTGPLAEGGRMAIEEGWEH
jgi:hypothetical protein